MDLHYVVRSSADGRVLATTLAEADGVDLGGLGTPARVSLLRHWDGARGSLSAGGAEEDGAYDVGVLPARMHACLASMFVGESARFWLPLDAASDVVAQEWLSRSQRHGGAAHGV